MGNAAGKQFQAGEARAFVIVALLLLALTVGIYAGALQGDLVYDGRTQILESDYIHQSGHFRDVLTLRVLGQDVLDGNRPTQLASLMLDAWVWGHRPVGFHLTSVALHVACVLLLFGLFVRWTSTRPAMAEYGAPPGRRPATMAAGLAAAVFAIHPVMVEAVVEPSYREDLLVGVCMLAAVWLMELRAEGGRSFQWISALGVVICALAAVGAKESGIALVPVLLVWARARTRHGPDRALRWPLAVVCVVVGLFLAGRFFLQPASSLIFPVRPARLGGSLGATLWIQLRIWALYVRHIVWPSALSADYSAASLSFAGPFVVAAVLVAAAAFHWLAARRSAVGCLWVVWFWASLLPASNLLPMYRPAADRYLYVPMMGVCGLLAVFLQGRGSRGRMPLQVTRLVLALALIPLSAATVARQSVFASDVTLWQDTLRATPDSATAMNNLGWAEFDAGRPLAAQSAFAQALRRTGRSDPDPMVGMALVAFEAGRIDEAISLLRTAVLLDPLYAHPADLRRALRLSAGQVERLRPLLALARLDGEALRPQKPK